MKLIKMKKLFYTMGMLMTSLTFGNATGYTGVSILMNSEADYAVYRYLFIQTFILNVLQLKVGLF